MTIEMGLLIAAIGCIIGVASFFGGQRAGARTDGEKWGRIETLLDRQGKDINALGTKLDRFIEESNRSDSELSKKFDESVRRLHDRIDSHIRNDHKIHLPKDGA